MTSSAFCELFELITYLVRPMTSMSQAQSAACWVTSVARVRSDANDLKMLTRTWHWHLYIEKIHENTLFRMEEHGFVYSSGDVMHASMTSLSVLRGRWAAPTRLERTNATCERLSVVIGSNMFVMMSSRRSTPTSRRQSHKRAVSSL